MRPEDQKLKKDVAKCFAEALFQTCGGSFPEENERKPIRDVIVSSILFPNKDPSSPKGKPYDIEIRGSLTLFHRWKRDLPHSKGEVVVVSDLGLLRKFDSPKDLAAALIVPLEECLRCLGMTCDVRFQASGIISLVSPGRSEVLRKAGKLPCPICAHWCKGEKGLWWHQQQSHNVEHSDAAQSALTQRNELAIVPYDPNHVRPKPKLISEISQAQSDQQTLSLDHSDDPFDNIRAGNLKALQLAVSNGFDPATSVDHRGASPLMWAAGGGHLVMVQYLIHTCACDPNKAQLGKRSFRGRTALHWAARNGNLPVVEFLVGSCAIDLEASTIDGTTAFCWACWQGHLAVMRYLAHEGCNIHCVNSYGCNPVLWCAQGKGDLSTLMWLCDKGCDRTLLNHNGHGTCHKAAQRGQSEICEWFFRTIADEDQREQSDLMHALNFFSPDTEGYTPSDLAGMEGYETLAKWLADVEISLIKRLVDDSDGKRLILPSWLTQDRDGFSLVGDWSGSSIWEKYGGIRRMRFHLRVSEEDEEAALRYSR